jgi:CheY-like chemotaxis protein
VATHIETNIRFCIDVVTARGERIFVATNARPTLGSIVEISVPLDDDLVFSCEATVVSTRPNVPNFPGGLYVSVTSDVVEECRSVHREANDQKIVKATKNSSENLPPVISLSGGAGLLAASGGALVVVADDDPSILEFSSKIIASAGHRILQASRGDEALELVKKERPALVVLDVLMPGLDGMQVCQAIRADEKIKMIPVLLLSAMGESTLAEAAAQVGASGFLIKPMRADALRKALEKHLNSSKI